VSLRKNAILLAALAVTACAQIPPVDPMFNRVKDPPDVYTISTVNNAKVLFRIGFFPYDQRVNVYQVPVLTAPAPKTNRPAAKPRLAGSFDENNFPPDLPPLASTVPPAQPQLRPRDGATAATPPDAEALQFDPWELPDPLQNFAFPAAPLAPPLPDPFAVLPNPPAVPGNQIPWVDFSLGALNITNSAHPLGFVAAPQQAAEDPRATVAKAISISIGPSPAGMVLSRDLTTAYVAVSGAGQVAVVDLTANAVKSMITIASGSAVPYSLALSHDDNTLYVGEAAPQGGLYAIDLPTATVTQLPIAVYYATNIVISPDDTRLWIANNVGSNVAVIDLLTNSVVATLPVVSPWAIAFNRTGTRVYISSAPRANPIGTVEVYDANSYLSLASIPVGHLPHSLGVTPSGRHVFVVNASSPGSVMQISTVTNAVIRTFPVGDSPSGLGMER
jgi:YVTN family beta-propeller protein